MKAMMRLGFDFHSKDEAVMRLHDQIAKQVGWETWSRTWNVVYHDDDDDHRGGPVRALKERVRETL